MATAESVKAKLQNLIALANNTTGNTDADLTTAVNALIAGFGSGGGGGVQIGDNTTVPHLLNLFYALENGTAVMGEFTLTAPYADTSEHLVFDSGLAALNGFLIVDADHNEKINGTSRTYYTLQFLTDGASAAYGSVSMDSIEAIANSTSLKFGIAQADSVRIDGGALYVTAKYAGNTNYTPFTGGHRYVWVAW